ncbi:MAG: polysaccharide lyase family 1 protein, partial [Acidiferrobacterales bacterium]
MRAIFRLSILVLFVSLTACGSRSSGGEDSTSFGQLVAFPGAEGFGAVSTGGRGGQVIEVTNLNNSGSGSLRACVDASGARTCVFRIGGTIDLSGNALKINNPFLTIAGQTAPGEGITLKGGSLLIKTHDVIVRYIRIRLGPLSGEDAFAISGYNIPVAPSRVIVDHVSISWGSDETASVDTSSTDSTIQWTIISEGLNFEDHGFGSLISSGSRRISFHHNLWAHFRERLPKLDGNDKDSRALQGEAAIYDFVNNVVYNWENYATAVTGSGMTNVVKNYFKLGPSADSFPGIREIRVFQEAPGIGLYVEGNVGPSCPNGCSDEWDAVTGSESHRLNQPINVPPVTTTSAIQARDDVFAGAGD